MELISKNKCTGCSACASICPKNCISMKEDDFGHVYPKIDDNKCIDCGACQRACPKLNKITYAKPKKCYAVWSLDADSRKSSASGGAAAEFYKTALENDYSICGVEYKDDYHVVHALSSDICSINGFKQSKYVYSEVNSAYKEIKQKLINNEKVLFISLPCKVAGLLSFLGEKNENLVTVDIVCHGVPSYRSLKEHIDFASKGQASDKLSFRVDNEFVFNLKNNNKNVYSKIGRTDTYLAAFLEGLNYRDNCYECEYAKSERVADITICDFWGLGAEIPFEHPYTGSVSAVLINTEQGNEFFETSKDKLFVEERTVDEAIKGNAQLNNPTPKHEKNDKYKDLYLENGFEYAVKSCLLDIMAEEEKRLKKASLKRNIRKIAGIFIKKYR